ncbi:hypothetical protein [Thermoclostridium caenicola]|uniref:Uncharacterized protein n=1 Tax=Thermoclostridium caenicola TaxID=659425 RepID=A0A1M6GT47_9FIRM|nr:hypothetical protein [Thermoclostridium caenicola]SHJ13133.1 hypothetical protein SAMN05444373_102626 [Thermoclostridium caenicola]
MTNVTDNIRIRWLTENGKKYLDSDMTDIRIEIDEEKKEIKNAKAFFRELAYNIFLNDLYKPIVLEENQDIEIPEVKQIIEELIEICNSELVELKDDIALMKTINGNSNIETAMNDVTNLSEKNMQNPS